MIGGKLAVKSSDPLRLTEGFLRPLAAEDASFGSGFSATDSLDLLDLFFTA